MEKQDSQCTHNLLRTIVALSRNVFASSAILTSDTISVEARLLWGLKIAGNSETPLGRM